MECENLGQALREPPYRSEMMVSKQQRLRRKRGAALVDALIASALLVMGSLAYFALVPVTLRSQKISQEQSTAVQIGNRIVEHLLLLKPSNLNATNLHALSLIDTGQTASPYSITNLPLDDGWTYSPAKVLPSGTGTMTITSVGSTSKLIKIEISWMGPNGMMTYTTGTALGGYR
jgi:Tfp pilus assembly protein PilV